MNRGFWVGVALCVCAALHAEKVIQCVSDFPIDPEMYTRFLHDKGYEGRVVVADIKDYKQQLSKKKSFLHKTLQKVGLDFPFWASLPEGVEKIVFFNLHSGYCKRYDFSRFPKEKLVLFMWEPRTILNPMYSQKVQACFSKVYTWDDSLVDGVKYFKFHYPVLSPMIADLVPFEEKKLCTLVSSNVKSKWKHELYSQREETISYFEQVKERGFEFYGRRWNAAIHPSYRGEIGDKIEVMKNYRFCICYENTSNVKGYITEKIFDCFAAGVVPVYWGADNVTDYIPKGCFIDRRDFDSLSQLHAFLKEMDKETYQGYIEQIALFLKSDVAQQFTQSQLLQNFYESLL